MLRRIHHIVIICMVATIEEKVNGLNRLGATTEPIRIDERCTFFIDPNGLPLEIYGL